MQRIIERETCLKKRALVDNLNYVMESYKNYYPIDQIDTKPVIVDTMDISLYINENYSKMTDEEIIEILSLRGDVKVFTMGYRGFDAGKSEFNKDNQERIFLCSVNK